jgi:stage III sporulation protein SpoIIIAA
LQAQITDDLTALLKVLPDKIREQLLVNGRKDHLLEVILDLGRVPTARYTDSEVILTEDEVVQDDIQSVVTRIGDFDADNRAGIARTLHRVSAIRNRKGDVVGLTCRVGRAVYGTIEIIQDIIESGENVLLLGAPGVGKTTMLREAARVLAETKRVVIVDTSNEIGGDGDIPHPAVGRGRRMQVAEPILQHEVMIEAVENHNPEVIVIDEIGRELEAAAARTIAERGVQLIGTAHGRTLDNLLLNPTLSDLVGGIESVTLSDEEARRRGTQKTVLERRAPPTFTVLIEIQDRQQLAIHANVGEAVDLVLRGNLLSPELRYRDERGEIQVEKASSQPMGRNGVKNGKRSSRLQQERPLTAPPKGKPVHVYPYGVARNRLTQAARRLKTPIQIVDDMGMAETMVTLKSYYRRRPRAIVDAERRNLPVFVLRANTVAQMENFLIDWFRLDTEADPTERALREADKAIKKVLAGRAKIDLEPQPAHLRRKQHELARQSNLSSRSYGKDPRRRVRIYRD